MTMHPTNAVTSTEVAGCTREGQVGHPPTPPGRGSFWEGAIKGNSGPDQSPAIRLS